MTSLLEQSVAQPKENGFLIQNLGLMDFSGPSFFGPVKSMSPQNLIQSSSFLIELEFTWVSVNKNETKFLKTNYLSGSFNRILLTKKILKDQTDQTDSWHENFLWKSNFGDFWLLTKINEI